METKQEKIKNKFKYCEVCGEESENNSGFCNKCFARKDVQRALFRI